ncbi:unnamed protein product [Caenorhabditis auriculariae]|uniref:PDZ domain-containing protein n=1 Tax=Caenorhabditis auriculariae TaxID=2777116 RepID=A0A8S1GTM3_9PELO|nr:unnamed protein product [Caenorhabditis auriculariae]
MPSFFCLPIACKRQIDSLDRRQNNLYDVPSDIDKYRRTLEYLQLSMNHIEALPKKLFTLRLLRVLDVSDNEIAVVPPDVAKLSSMVELNLSRNKITDLPEELKECRELRILDLSGNAITRFPDVLVKCESIMSLCLLDVSLTALPQNIGQLKNLRILEARDNLLRKVPSSIVDLANLQVLDLGLNEINEIPEDMGKMESLREFYIDSNGLNTLPESITKCRQLEQLDVSDNKLMVLPADMGDLVNLTDVCVSLNSLEVFPNSIGRLKKLSILKADRNCLTELTESIGDCESLVELHLFDNLLSEIPQSIGQLRKLNMLHLAKNQITACPETIGSCESLSVLILRDNSICDLPMTIGKCENLKVLDVAANKLTFLPFTINVLYKLQALWLAVNQPQTMVKLSRERDPRTGMQVLTCYLLPQASAANEEERAQSRSFLGGPKVHFPDEEATVDEEKGPIGQFERHNTPHPKPAKLKKNSIDGHIIHHDEDQPTSLLLKKPTSPQQSFASPTSPPSAAPRSSLKNQSLDESSASRTRANETITSQNSTQSEQTSLRRIVIRRDASKDLGLSIAGGRDDPYIEGDSGIFVTKVNPGSAADKAGLMVDDKLIRANDISVTDASQKEAVAVMKAARDNVELLVRRSDSALNSSASLQAVRENGGGSRESISALTHGSNGRMTSSPATSSIGMPLRQETPSSVGSPPRGSINGLYAETNGSSLHDILDDEHDLRIPDLTLNSTKDSFNLSKDADFEMEPANSPLPAAIPEPVMTKPKLPPPVAPKPILKRPPVLPPQDLDVPVANAENAPPERMNFASKLEKFKAIDVKTPPKSLPPPEKKPLLSMQDMQKLKEEEVKKLAKNGGLMYGMELSPEKESYDHFLEDSPLPRQPSVIRTKKAENRAIAAGLITANDEGLSEDERIKKEQQQRSEWRAARLKSLEQRSADADALMHRLQISSPIAANGDILFADE